jgi:glycosyltransferase involved in cell wall biosynthesis
MKSVAFHCHPELVHFIEPIRKAFEKNSTYNSIKCYNYQTEDFERIYKSVDINWLEWANEKAIILTNEFPHLLRRKKTICRLHSYEYLNRLYEKVEWRLISDVIFVSEHMQAWCIDYIRNNNPSIQSHIIPNGIDTKKFALTAYNSYNPQKPQNYKISHIGYISNKKGPMLLIQAFYEFFKTLPPVERDPDNLGLYWAGELRDRRYKHYIEHIINSLGIEKYIHFDGWIDDVPAWLEDKSFIVCSSPWESQNCSVMEGMAMGLKPLVHAFPGADTIYDNKYIWRSISDFVNFLKEDCYNPIEYRSYVIDNYNLTDIIYKIDTLFRAS